MSNYDEFRFSFKDSSAEEKLTILRSESFRRLPIIKGFAELVRHALEKPETVEKPDELKEWLLQVTNAAQILHDLIDAMTSSQNQERGLLELRPYDSLLDAVHDTAQKLDLSLAGAIDDATQIFVYGQYPLVLRDEPKFHRQIYFHLANSKYVVELLSWVGNRMFQKDLQVSFSTLDDVVVVINQWLLEKRTLDEMQEMYPSPKKDN